VRRCHGDLHLNNIVLWRGRPVLFDAIEFDEELATIDTLYDLAFLLMDLSRRRQRPAGNLVLNRYLWRSGADLDFRGLQALPLFLGLRAAIVRWSRPNAPNNSPRKTRLAPGRLPATISTRRMPF
jgi:aminoglycoside phosphotransferase family enzyme